MSNIKLCYFGGSGGFILLHLLLLSNKFSCVFPNNATLNEVIEKQWNICNNLHWKQTEVWPLNTLTYKESIKNQKIYFFCNPKIEDVSKFDGKIIFLYTDALTQLKLAHYKRAFIYTDVELYSAVKYYKYFLQLWKHHYNNIKDPSWPVCYGPKKFKRLSQHIQQEMLLHDCTDKCLNFPEYSTYLQNSYMTPGFHSLNENLKELLDGTKVLDSVFDFAQYANVAVKLQDIINDISLLSNITNKAVTQQQTDLRNKWILLHPAEMLNQIGIKR